MISQLDELSINTIRFLAVDMVQQANSGHPGLPLGAAPMAYALWNRFLKFNPHNPNWFDRDRFVLSAGHGSALLYALLYLTGYHLPLQQLKRFRQWYSVTPGHPEAHLTPGVETTTGPLGQGFANGVGMAIAEAHLAARYNRPGFKVVNHYTYALVSDGDLMEGVASEAASLAGHLRLGKLIYLYDDNHVSLAASTDITFTEDRAARFEAYGWHTQKIPNGNDLEALSHALRVARAEQDRPSVILVRTHIGYGSPHKQDSYKAHGSPLGEEEVTLTKQNLGWPTEPPFYVPDQVLGHMRQAVERGQEAETEWNERFAAYAQAYPGLAADLQQMIDGKLPEGWDANIPFFEPDSKGMRTRRASQQVINAIAPRLPGLVGGAADLAPSTYTLMKGLDDFESPDLKGDRQGSTGDWSYAGRNLHFGVREHAMGAVLNGMAAHGGLIPYGATFLIFSDYMKPAIRLAALMNLPVVYVFTHDSIGLGEDGPTHQPVEQLVSLRAIPELLVIRPGDANETAVAWRVAVETHDRPVALILSRQDIPILDRSQVKAAQGLRQGAYILADAPSDELDLILIASGSEISLCLRAQQELQAKGILARVVSMPSWKLFDAQPQAYRDSVLPPTVGARLAVEAGAPLGWHRYVGDRGEVLGVETFGASAPGEVVMYEYGFTVDEIVERARALACKEAEEC
jgi:transketolase